MRRIFGLILMLQSVFLSGQMPPVAHTDALFSALDRAFNEALDPTPEDEYYIGRAVAANILASHEIYISNPELIIYLNHICQALVINSNYPSPFNGYYVTILNSPEFNAFATPGGHIFLTRGLIEAAPCEDGLAGIIAHELAHIMLRHGMKIIDDMKITEEIDLMARQAAAFSNRQTAVFRDSVNEMFYAMARNGYSVPQEYEADMMALKLLAAAGYNPGGLPEMLNILQKVQRSQSGGFNDTHPTPAQRIENLEKQMPLYRMADNNAVRQKRFIGIMKRNLN